MKRKHRTVETRAFVALDSSRRAQLLTCVDDQSIHIDIVLNDCVPHQALECRRHQIRLWNVFEAAVTGNEPNQQCFDDEVAQEQFAAFARHAATQKPDTEPIEHAVPRELKGQQPLERDDHPDGGHRNQARNRPYIAPGPALQISVEQLSRTLRQRRRRIHAQGVKM